MAGIGLKGVLTADFLDRFTRVGTKSSLSARSLSGESDQDSLAAGLRIGARTFSTAIDGLNAAASYVNLSEQSLEQLKDVTNQLIDVTKQATLISTNSASRDTLDIRFHKLSSEFRNIVRNATSGDNEFLTRSGLEEVFKSVGLDSETSSSIAGVFSSFITPATDDALASEYVSGGQERIPVGAFHTHSADSSTTFTKVTNSGINRGQISTVNSVFSDTDTILNQNPTARSLLTTNLVGSTTGLSAGSLSRPITLLDVNETNGYSIISSADDFLGFNADAVANLFLVDPNGVVLQQITANTNADVSYRSASVSQNNGIVAFISRDAGSGLDTAQVVTLGTADQDPSTFDILTVETNTNLNKIAINNAGTSVAYINVASSEGVLYSIDGGSFDTTFATDTAAALVSELGFYSESGLAYMGSGRLYQYDGVSTELGSGNIGSIAVLEDNGSGGVIAYEDETARTVKYAQGPGGTFGAFSTIFEYASSDSVTRLSLAYNVDGTNIDFGIQGALVSKTGSSASELYRIQTNPQYGSGKKFKRASPDEYDPISGEQQNSIFADSRSIDTRAEAYRTLNDLKALKGQIEKNLSALGDARSLIADNIKLLKATGKAFVEESERLSDEKDAEDLAIALRDRIKNSTSTAVLAQADNLNSITVAALTSLLAKP